MEGKKSYSLFNVCQLTVELLVVGINRIFNNTFLLKYEHFSSLKYLREFMSNLDISQRLQQFQFGLNLVFSIDDEVGHRLESEIMRDVRVEVI